jgi:hypothetical protein
MISLDVKLELKVDWKLLNSDLQQLHPASSPRKCKLAATASVKCSDKLGMNRLKRKTKRNM